MLSHPVCAWISALQRNLDELKLVPEIIAIATKNKSIQKHMQKPDGATCL